MVFFPQNYSHFMNRKLFFFTEVYFPVWSDQCEEQD
jgi:hypothetical protein